MAECEVKETRFLSEMLLFYLLEPKVVAKPLLHFMHTRCYATAGLLLCGR